MAMVTTDAAAATTTAAMEKPPDAEKPDYAPYNGNSTADGGGGVVDSVVARWRREDMLDKSPLALHAAAAVFAFVALVLVASNQHGDWMQFDRYQEYKYLLAIAALAFLYSLAQAAQHALRMRGGVDPVAAPSGRLLDFVGDQAIGSPNPLTARWAPLFSFVSHLRSGRGKATPHPRTAEAEGTHGQATHAAGTSVAAAVVARRGAVEALFVRVRLIVLVAVAPAMGAIAGLLLLSALLSFSATRRALPLSSSTGMAGVADAASRRFAVKSRSAMPSRRCSSSRGESAAAASPRGDEAFCCTLVGWAAAPLGRPRLRALPDGLPARLRRCSL
ncbi:CASP-like protein 4B1 [Panicum miliaceum]|uniref:CASP-like protein n=1 Tax=Panicum miliaceum TaxID=4540 RepID=A0A3L6TGX8_PANMI|nr:CASP-like protein 4B1 [Panicum miliaceum]